MGRKTKQSSFWYSLSRSSSAPVTPRPEPATATRGEPPIGCMSMVHYLIFAPGAGCVGRPPTASSCNGAVVTPHDGLGLGGHQRDDGDGNISSCKKTSSSGFDAPRNSLDELDADNPNDIQIGVQIEPAFDALVASSRTASMRRAGTGKPTAPSSEAETPRTPSLVARLMGIDGLPDSPSPAQPHKLKPGGRRPTTTAAAAGKENTRSCCSSPPPASASACKGEEEEKKKRVIPESMTMNRRRDREPLRSLSCNVAVGETTTRSLPDTPRESTSARASWDGVPRLSLQALIRENVLDRAAQYMSMPSSPTSLSAAAAGDGKRKKKSKDAGARRRGRDEQSAAAKEEHAREILRQAKETVASRKSGSSGKNKNSSGSSSPAPEKKRQQSSVFDNNNKENVVMTPAPAMDDDDKLPVFVVVEPTLKPEKQSREHQIHSTRVALAPRRQQQQEKPSPPPHRAKPSRPPPPPPPLDPPPTRARKPDGRERFATRATKKPPPAAACSPTTAPTSSTSSSSPSPSTTTKDCSSSATPAAARSSSPQPLVLEEEHPEYRYLRSVLERGGFMRSSPPPPSSRRQWRGQYYSSSSVAGAASWPVDPIVFHLLELDLPLEEESRQLGALRHRWNRKLLFHLAQELLADHLDMDASSSSPSTGLPLLGKVWERVRRFPAADCRVVGDIDALVAADLMQEDQRRRRRRRGLAARHPAAVAAEEEEARGVAAEVADQVLDALLAAESVSLSSSILSSSSPDACAAHGSSSSSRAAAAAR